MVFALENTVFVRSTVEGLLPIPNGLAISRSLISAFVVHCLDSIIPLVSVFQAPS